MQASQDANPRKLFVGNLSYHTTDAQLREYFGQYGELEEVNLVTDRFTGRSKGFAFITFKEESAAQAAIEATNNVEFDGRALVVNVARPPAPREFGGGNRSGGGGGRPWQRDNNRGGYGGGGGGGYKRDFGRDRSSYGE